VSPKLRLFLLAGALAFGALVAGFSRVASDARERAGRSPALSLIPPGPAFVLTVDVAKLRRSELGRRLGRRLSERAGLDPSCGFEPVPEVDELALAVQGSNPGSLGGAGMRDEIGVVATGSFAKAAVLGCAERAIGARKGEPVKTEIAGFGTVRDRAAPDGELAARDGLLILSGGNYFRELLDRAGGGAKPADPASPGDAVHAELRRKLGATAPLMATWLLPRQWTERFVARDEAKLSPLTALRAIGMRATFDRPSLEALLGCTSEAGCRGVARFLEELRETLGAELELDPTLRLARRVEIEQNTSEIKLHLTLEPAELEHLIGRALEASPSPLP
jgi:hypothetical protein